MSSSLSSKIQWLRRNFVQGSLTGPHMAHVRFSEVHRLLLDAFPSDKCSWVEASRLLHFTFPSVEIRRDTKGKKETFCIGLERCSEAAVPPPATVPPPAQLPLPVTVPPPATVLPPAQAPPPAPARYYETLLRQEQATNAILAARVEQLEQQLQTIQHTNLQKYKDEFLHLVLDSNILGSGPSNLKNLEGFSLSAMATDIQTKAPNLYSLLCDLGDTERNGRDTSITQEKIKAITSICTLANARSQRVKGMQLFLSLMLIARAVSKQALCVLNHAGVCLSYDMTWKYLRSIIEEMQRESKISSGHWIWAYDNFNIHQKVRHEPLDHHNKMENTTTRLAVRMQNHPPYQVDWSDKTPQKSRCHLQESDILPNDEDAEHLSTHMLAFIMSFIVKKLKSLSDLYQFLPTESCNAQKSEVLPLKLLFRDEKQTDENIQILLEFVKEAKLDGSPQVIFGDQATCKTIRGAKKWSYTEIEDVKKLQWAHEVPGDFHFLWECLKVILEAYWGSVTTPGSMCNLREQIHRHKVDKSGTKFSEADEFVLHAFEAHLMTHILNYFGISSSSEPIVHECSLKWLKEKSQAIVDSILVLPETSDKVLQLSTSFIHCAFLYCDLRRAIRFEDGEHIIRHWQFWLPYFLGMGRKNYSNEAANLICNIKADFPKHISHIAIHNRTVNTTGKPGHGKPIDQMVEHYNLVIKQALKSSGANCTEKHMEEVSLCGLFLLEVAKKADEQFQTPTQSTYHRTRSAKSDIDKMTNYLVQENIAKSMLRSVPAFTEPMEMGMKHIVQGWLTNYIAKGGDQDDEIQNYGEIDPDYNIHDTTII